MTPGEHTELAPGREWVGGARPGDKRRRPRPGWLRPVLVAVPLVAMAAGLVFVVVTVVRIANPPETAAEKAAKAARAAAAARCAFPGCPAAADAGIARAYEDPGIAVDPRNPSHVVVTDVNLQTGACTWHTTTNAGQDWTDGAFPVPSGFRGCGGLDSAGLLPAGGVAFGPSGTVYAVFSSAGGWDGVASRGALAQHESVLLAVSSDGGKAFTSHEAVKPPDPDPAYIRPTVTVAPGPGGRDEVLITTTECKTDPTRATRACIGARFARSTDGGDTFAPSVDIAPQGGSSPGAAVVAPDGAIYTTIVRRFGDGSAEAVLERSTDGGQTFASATLDLQPGLGAQYDPVKLALDAKGAIYAAYADAGKGSLQVVVRKSTDKGATFSEPVVINAGLNGTTNNPQISVAPNGRVDVVFYRQPNPDTANAFWAYSTDGGTTFVSRQLNDKPIDRRAGYSAVLRSSGIDHYAPAIASTNATAYAAWSDTRDATKDTETQDVVFRRLEVNGS
ncbi:MAG: sialidase family protein [Acidimicrobiales bacterium]